MFLPKVMWCRIFGGPCFRMAECKEPKPKTPDAQKRVPIEKS
jgi:hypothetical protein